jgi:diguanylate cyclase (GGDEF)-like protein/PAS domain S-box-containing protein
LTRLSPATRISICLAFISVNVILAAQVFGLLPSLAPRHTEDLGQVRDAVSIRCTTMAQRGDLAGLRNSAAKIVDVSEAIGGVVIRHQDGGILTLAGNVRKDMKLSNKSVIYIPIEGNTGRWGSVELFLESPKFSAYGLVTHPLIGLAAFAASLTYLVSLAYVRTVLWHLDPSMVVPDHVRSALDTINEGLLVLDTKARIAFTNRAFSSILDATPDDLKGRDVNELTWKLCKSKAPWQQVLEDNESCNGRVVVLIDNKNQEHTFVVNSSVIVDQDGKKRGALVSFDDVTALEKKQVELQKLLKTLNTSREESRRRNRELEELATRDSLTGCHNRRAFSTEFDNQWEAANRYGHSLSFVMVDVDLFKGSNDTHGHSVGDEVLQAVSATFLAAIRGCDVVCRYGGEEFCILLPHVEEEGALVAAERYRAGIEKLDVRGIKVTASFGVASLGSETGTAKELLEQSDRALYFAKQNGRNCVKTWREFSESKAEVADDGNGKSLMVTCVPRDVAKQIGEQVDQLIEAIEAGNADVALTAVDELRETADAADVTDIQKLANRLRESVANDIECSETSELATILLEAWRVSQHSLENSNR